MTWLKTITGERVNSAHAISVQTKTEGNRYEVELEFIPGTSRITPTSMYTIFQGEDKAEFDAFLDDLDNALPMLPIGEHKPKSKPAKKTATKSTSKAPRAKAKQNADADNDR